MADSLSILTVVNAAVVTINGLFVAAIAYRQYRIAQDKLKLDLYERRYKIYEAVVQFIVDLRVTANVPDATLFAFIRATSDVPFLFNSDVDDFLTSIRKKAHDFRAHEDDASMLPEHSDLWIQSKNAASRSIHSLEVEYNKVTEVFHPYLGFSKLKRG